MKGFSIGEGEVVVLGAKHWDHRRALSTGYPRKNAADLKNSNSNCFILIIKRLLLLNVQQLA